MMPRYIKLDDAVATLHKYFPLSFDRQDAEDDLKSIPAADVEEVKHGEWMCDAEVFNRNVWVRWSCSECAYVRTQGWRDANAGTKPLAKLCENCGAKMDGKEKKNEN